MSEIDDLKKNAQVRKFMAKYRYQYHNTMLNDLAELITSQTTRARFDELESMQTYLIGLAMVSRRKQEKMLERLYDINALKIKELNKKDKE